MQDSSYDHKDLAFNYIDSPMNKNVNVVASPVGQLPSYGSLLSANQGANIFKTLPHQSILKTSPDLISPKRMQRSNTNQNSKTDIRIKDDNCISIAILKSPEQLQNQNQQEILFVKLNEKQSMSFLKQVKQHSEKMKIQNAEQVAIQAEKFGGFFGSYLQENGVTLDVRDLVRRKSPKQNDFKNIQQELSINGIQKVITQQNNIIFKTQKSKFSRNKLSKGLGTDLATIRSSIEPDEYTQQVQSTFQSQDGKPVINTEGQTPSQNQQSKDNHDQEQSLMKMHKTIKLIHDQKSNEHVRVTRNQQLKKPVGSTKYFEPGSLQSFEQSGQSLPKMDDSMREILSDLHQETIKMLRERATYQTKTLDQSTEETKVYQRAASQKRSKYEFSQELSNSRQEFTTSKEIFEYEGRVMDMGKTRLTIVKEDESVTEQLKSVQISAQTSLQPISTQNTPSSKFFQIIGLSNKELKRKSTNQLNPFSPRQDQYLKPSDTYLIKINDQESKNTIYERETAENAVQDFFQKKKLSQIDNVPKKLKLKPLEYSLATRKANETPNMFRMGNKEEIGNAVFSAKNNFTEDKWRRQKCLFHQFDQANQNQWKYLQLLTDVLPTSQNIHAVQKKVPSNLYRKNEHKRTQSVINKEQYQSHIDSRKDTSNSVLLPLHIQSNAITQTTIDQSNGTNVDSFDDRKINWNRVMKKFRTYMNDNSLSTQSYRLDPRLKNASTTPTEQTSVMKIGLQEGQSSLIGIKMESKSSLKNQSTIIQFDSRDSSKQQKNLRNQISIRQDHQELDPSCEYQTQTEISSEERSLSPNATLLRKLNQKNLLNQSSNLITERDDDLLIPSYQIKTTNKSKKKRKEKSKDLEEAKQQYKAYQSQDELESQPKKKKLPKKEFINQRSDPTLQEALSQENNSALHDYENGIVYVEQPSAKELISLDNGVTANISTLNDNQYAENNDSWMTPIEAHLKKSQTIQEGINGQHDFQTEINLPSLSDKKQFQLGARTYREALQVMYQPHIKELLQGVKQRFMEFEQISKVIKKKNDNARGILVQRDQFQNFKRFSHCADNIHLKDKEYHL